MCLLEASNATVPLGQAGSWPAGIGRWVVGLRVVGGGLEKLCHPGLGAELGGGVVAGSCANATIDAASKPNAMQ